jgi:hypothetical protein
MANRCFAARILGAGLVLVACSSDPAPSNLVFDLQDVDTTFQEVVPCKQSHEHDLRYVRIFADPVSAPLFETCVLNANTERCPVETFPEGALFVKYEYEYVGCKEQDLVSYTATLKLAPGSYPAGKERASKSLRLEADGAPPVCLTCHINHCAVPKGFDMRCLPD